MGDRLVVFVWNREGEFGDFELLRALLERLETLSQLGKQTLHTDAVEGGVLYSGVVGVELRNGVNTCSGAAMNQRLTSTVRVVGIW